MYKTKSEGRRDETPQFLLKRRDRAFGYKSTWRTLMNQAYMLALPNSNPYRLQSPGANMAWNVYDCTLELGLTKFVNRMINALVPSDISWVKFVSGHLIPKDSKEEVDLALQEITDIFFFYLRQSNFDLVIHEAFTDMAISLGVIQINEGPDDDPLIFSCVPSAYVGIETGPRGNINAFFRDWYGVHEYHCMELWGEDFVVPDGIQRPQNDDELYMDLYEITYYDYKDELYKTFVIEKSTSKICYKKESESWEWIGFRWAKLASEDYGRGPVLSALASAATINKAMQDELALAALKCAPPLMAVTENIINPYTFKIAPNEIIRVMPGSNGDWPLQPFPVGGDIQFAQVIVSDLRSQINEIMMAAPLNLPPKGPVRTATEVAMTQNELRENAGAQFARVQKELFDPLVERILWILQKKGFIAPITVDGKQTALSYTTPLMLSKNQVDLQNLIEWFQVMAGMLTPGVAINALDATKLPRWIGEKLNADLSLIKDEGELLALVQEAQQIGEQQIEQQQPGQPQPQEPLSTGLQ
jgi:hypothetical protein